VTPTAADLQSLLYGVCCYPNDVFRRLVYADALEDAGQSERGEFIRVQCELADIHCTCGVDGTFVENGIYGYGPRTKEPCGCCCRRALRRRERELLTAKNAMTWGFDSMAWLNGLESPFQTLNFTEPMQGYVGTLFRRGFVEVVHCRSEDWLKHGPAIVRAQPILDVLLADMGELTDLFNLRQEHPVVWARGPHHGLEALPTLED